MMYYYKEKTYFKRFDTITVNFGCRVSGERHLQQWLIERLLMHILTYTLVCVAKVRQCQYRIDKYGG